MLTLTNAALSATVAALTCLGASRANNTAATGSGDGSSNSGVASAAEAGSQGGMQQGVIRDPTLDMDAYTVTYPAKWHFQGVLVQGTPCSAIPFPVFRMFSPDGLTEIEQLPRLDWYWSDAPNASKTPDGCLPFKQAMSAKDFLKYISAILKVEYVSERAVDPAVLASVAKTMETSNAAFAKQSAARGIPPAVATDELAEAIVRYENGSFPMEGLLTVSVNCFQTSMPSLTRTGQPGKRSEAHTCSATVGYMHAPEAKFKAVDAQTAHDSAAYIPQWVSAHMAQVDRQAQQNLAALRQQSAQQLAAQQQSFEQGQAMRQRQHEDFMSTMQRGTDMSMNQAAQIANTNHAIASDWTDYSLDQQTVRDPNTGQLSKVSSTSSFTWLDASGKTSFQTNDPNANPNGTLQGTWTRQQKVHGDGSN
jgi:hypothetical protein